MVSKSQITPNLLDGDGRILGCSDPKFLSSAREGGGGFHSCLETSDMNLLE